MLDNTNNAQANEEVLVAQNLNDDHNLLVFEDLTTHKNLNLGHIQKSVLIHENDKREAKRTQAANNQNYSEMKKLNSSNFAFRSKESRSDNHGNISKLDKNSVNFKVLDSKTSASRNNAYNSLGDWYKVGSVESKIKSDNTFPGMNEPGKIASASLNISRGASKKDSSDVTYSKHYNISLISDSNKSKKMKSQMKSPYNVHTKKKKPGNSKNRSIESDSKEVSTNISNAHQSEPRYKTQNSLSKHGDSALRTQFLNSKVERSWRMPLESHINADSKRSNDMKLIGYENSWNREFYPDENVRNINTLVQYHVKGAFEDDQHNLQALLIKTKQQAAVIEEYKEKESKYQDRIYQLEKELTNANHMLGLLKIDHEKEVSELNK